MTRQSPSLVSDASRHVDQSTAALGGCGRAYVSTRDARGQGELQMASDVAVTAVTTGAALDSSTFTTFDEAVDMYGGNLVISGSADLVDKEALCGVPFLITAYRFNQDETSGRPFVSVECITTDNHKVVFNDGGTGVLRQLKALSEKAIMGGIMCRKGLRASHYTAQLDSGTEAATTYYLA
jgi:hypothetical protein